MNHNQFNRINFFPKRLLTFWSFEQGQATSCRSRLVSLGRHRLRGVREEAELFALAPVQPL